jgi:hypothetical protein
VSPHPHLTRGVLSYQAMTTDKTPVNETPEVKEPVMYDPVKLLDEGLDRLALADAAHAVSQTPGATGMKVFRPDGQTLELHGPAVLNEATHQLTMAHGYLTAALAASNIALAYPVYSVDLDGQHLLQPDPTAMMEKSDGSVGD